VRTDDSVADLVIEYAKALARHATSDTVAIPAIPAIPAIGPDDVVRETTLLIGPASQLVVTALDAPPRPDLDPTAALAHLRACLARLQQRPVLTEQPDADEEAISYRDKFS
jgi:hypothetical protein